MGLVGTTVIGTKETTQPRAVHERRFGEHKYWRDGSGDHQWL